MSTSDAFHATPGMAASDAPALGALQREFKPARRGLIIGLVVGVLLAAGGVFAVPYGLVSGYLKSDDGVPVAIIGGILILVGWGLIENWIRNRSLSCQLFADGLVMANGSKVDTLRWTDISAVWQRVTKHYYNGVYTGTTHIYTVQTNDGKKLKFNDRLRGVEALGDELQKQVTVRALPAAISTYQSGGTVNFGKLAISPTGLTSGNKTLPWAEIEGVQLQRGFIQVKKQGKWFKWANIPVASVPNMLVFLTMVDRIVGIGTKK